MAHTTSTIRRSIKTGGTTTHRRPMSSITTPTNGPSLHFYRNRQMELYAAKEAKRLSLRQLVFFGRSMNEERLVASANYVRQELPVRIAHRIRDMQALPYVVVTQEWISKVYELYWDAFEKFRRFPPIENLEQNEKFCKFVGGLLEEHSRVIPYLSLGLSMSSPHLPPDKLDAFMRRMLVSRISRRVLAEHHIALSNTLSQTRIRRRYQAADDDEDHVGIIYTNLSMKDSITRCTELLRGLHVAKGRPMDVFPRVELDGHTRTKFAYIKEHLDYIVFELLHNAIRSTRGNATVTPPHIRATIVAGPNDVHLRISDNGGGLSTPDVSKPTDLYSFSHVRNATRLAHARLGALRTVSAMGGMHGTVAEQLASAEPMVSSEAESAGRIGLGLPMSNIYATYFGGSLNLMSLDGWGTDVYLKLPKLGTNLEGVEV